MKFEKRFFFSVIPEWKDQYVALEALLTQIESVKNAALKLATSIANIKKLEKHRNLEVDLHSIRPDKQFWEMLNDNLHKVETFYETQLSSFLEQFHNLTLQAILLDKIEEYIPFNPGQATKLERELGRLPNNKNMPIGVLGVDEQIHRPIGSSRLIGLDKRTNIEDVKDQLKRLKPSVESLRRSGEAFSPPPTTLPSTAPGAYRNITVTGSTIEDHLRDFQYASAQLQDVQPEYEDALPTEMGYNPVYHRNGTQTIGSTHLRQRSEYRDGDMGPAQRHTTSPNNAHLGHDQRMTSAPTPHDPLSHMAFPPFNRNALPRSESEHDISFPHPHYPKHLGSSDSSVVKQGVHNAIVAQQNGNGNNQQPAHDWRHDTLFDSSANESPSPRPGTLTPHSRSSSKDESQSYDELMINPPVKMRRQELPPQISTPTPRKSPKPLNASDSGYSSFFDSEGSASDLDQPGEMEDVPIRSSGSESGNSSSKDSGYDSGQSFEGFAEEGHIEEQEERLSPPPKSTELDSETTSSLHGHVPETRLRKGGATSSSLVPGVLEKSGSKIDAMKKNVTSSANLSVPAPRLATHSTSPPSSSADPRPKSMDNAASQRQRELLSSDHVQPLLTASTPSRLNIHRDESAVNEVEMTTFGGMSGPNMRQERKVDVMHEPQILRPPSPRGGEEIHFDDAVMPDNVVDEVELDLGEHTAPPRTTFYQMPDPRKIDRKKALRGLQNGFSELYRGLHLLKRYAELNVEACDKVLSKYEKNIERGHRMPFMRDVMKNFNFSKGQELRSLISQTEYVYAQAFTEGHRTPAMQKLRVPEEEEDMEATTLRFGLLFGLSLGFALIILYMTIVVRSSVIQQMRPDLIVFRMLFIATLMVWYWGVDMWIWSSYRVNYPFIFEFNTRGHVKHQNVFDIASVFTVVLIGDMMLYMLSALQRYDEDFFVPGFEFLRHVPPELYPLILVVLLLGLFIFYSVRSSFWLVRTLGRIVTAPVYKVVFRDFFLADQLVSISIVLQDIDFTICYFTTSAFRGGGNSCATNHVWINPILSTLPSLWRLLQCFRRYHDSKDIGNMQNAGKYTAGMLVAISSSMRSIVKGSTSWLVAWLILVVIATIYSYLWDIYRDWSIGDRKSPNWMLRDQLLYPKWWYYAAALTNLLLRLMWTLTISPDAISSVFFLGRDGFTTLLVIVEVSRRAMWNLFRLENEQINNCGRFRAVQDIPLPLPLKPAVEDKLYQDHKIK